MMFLRVTCANLQHIPILCSFSSFFFKSENQVSLYYPNWFWIPGRKSSFYFSLSSGWVYRHVSSCSTLHSFPPSQMLAIISSHMLGKHSVSLYCFLFFYIFFYLFVYAFIYFGGTGVLNFFFLCRSSGFKLMIILPQPLKCGNYKRTPPHLACIPFYCQKRCHCINKHFVYALIRWTSGLFSLFGYYESATNIHVQVCVWEYAFSSLEYMPQSRIAGSRGNCVHPA
jgi:hypothetical protein